VGQLIVNADDFGLTHGVNRAVLELHCAGLLTSATLMARAAATEEAIDIALATPSLGVGCHVVLVDGDPVLPANQIPSLADRQTGHLLPTLGAFLRRLAAGRMRPADIEAEAAAQIALLQSRGLRLTHVDTHKHTQLFPTVLRPVLRAAKAAGIRVVRNPFEPVWAVNATPGAPWLRRVQVRLLGRLEKSFLRIVTQEGFTTTNGSIGVAATGTLNPATVASLLQQLPQGTFELVTHPGYNDVDLAHARTRLLASRETEITALQTLRQFPQIELISFAIASSSLPKSS
jgi:chitin disaccharide deacetylase